jgi:hypothetical protein
MMVNGWMDRRWGNEWMNRWWGMNGWIDDGEWMIDGWEWMDR